MKLSDMQRKDIVFLSDGKKVGRIIDADIEVTNGKIVGLSIERKGIKSVFNTNADINIKFEQIKKIGEDVILIDSLE